jgi:hypothetical protein
MTDNPPVTPETESQPVETDRPSSKPTSHPKTSGPTHKKGKSQPLIVWAGIVCLLVAAFAGWQAVQWKKWFPAGAKNLTIIRGQQAMTEWAAKLRENGGPMCNDIAQMVTEEKLPESLRERGITNLEDLSFALAEGGQLYPICARELTGQWNRVAWGLALFGIALILIDVLRERGVLGGTKKPQTK